MRSRPSLLTRSIWEETLQPTTHHLKAHIEFVEQGNTLWSHDDVLEYIREQLFAEEQQRLDRRPNLPLNVSTPFPPVDITNVLPSSHQSSITDSVDTSTTSVTRLLV
jgi:hypothetical protein